MTRITFLFVTEGQGPQRAVEPVMMMKNAMFLSNTQMWELLFRIVKHIIVSVFYCLTLSDFAFLAYLLCHLLLTNDDVLFQLHILQFIHFYKYFHALF